MNLTFFILLINLLLCVFSNNFVNYLSAQYGRRFVHSKGRCDEAGALTSVVLIRRSAAEAAAPFCICSCSYLSFLS
jgi:hypothetical protein